MKNRLYAFWASIILFLSVIYPVAGQHYYCAVAPNAQGLIELSLTNSCTDNVQWQVRDTSSEEWTDIIDGTVNPYVIQVDTLDTGRTIFRAVVDFPTVPSTQLFTPPFGIKLIGSYDEIEQGHNYDGSFIYHAEAENMLGFFYHLEAASWGCEGIDIPGADEENIGSGLENTADIIQGCSDVNTAAGICQALEMNGHDDWFLPAREDMLPIRATFSLLGPIGNEYYYGLYQYLSMAWTSTEIDSVNAVAFDFIYGRHRTRNKNQALKLIIARRIDMSQPFSNICQTFLDPNVRIEGKVQVTPVNGGHHSVMVEYIGPELENAKYNWDFGVGGVVSGSGKGPYEIKYDFGGYNKAYLSLEKEGCQSPLFQSEYFRVHLFENIEAPFPPIYAGSPRLFDYNNDGLKDVMLTGSDTTQLYKNVGGDAFEPVATPFPNLSNSHCSWGDYDNDNLPDLIICGYSRADSTPVTRLYRNLGNDQFEEVPAGLPDIDSGFVEWADVNNDGAIDLLLAGEDADGEIMTQLFLNQDGAFVPTESGLENVRNGGAAFADYNKDNYVDLIFFGNKGEERCTRVYRNDRGTFSALDIDITGVDNGGAGWADIDNDGDLDFAITGNRADYFVDDFGHPGVDYRLNIFTRTFYNEGSDSFVSGGFSHSNSDQFTGGNLDWGDYDNDGDPDLAITGTIGIQTIQIPVGGGGSFQFSLPSSPRIYRNDGQGILSNTQYDIPNFYSLGSRGPSLTGFSYLECSVINFVDYENDGDLDIIREGQRSPLCSTCGYKAAIYKNHTDVSNAPPTIPGDLTAEVRCDTVLLSWNSATDDHTPASSITYELYVGTAPGAGNVFSRQNKREIRNNYFEIATLENGTYYWSVKAVDGARYGSDYAAEQTFVIDRPGDVAMDTALCFGETLTVNGLSYSDSGVYTDTLLLDGCPITQQVTLEVLPEKTAFIDTTLCAGESLVINGATYDSSVSNAVEVVTGVGPLGCDSTIYATITVLPEKIHYLDTTICKGDMLLVNGNIYSEPVVGALEVISGVGEYGCDSIVVINLEVRDVEELIAPEEVAITTADTLLITTEQSFESYLWQDGSTLPYFIVSGPDYEPGEYLFTLLAIDEWGCAWRDSVLVTIELFVNANDDPSLRTPRLTAFPNPADGVLNLISNGAETKIQITLRDLQGRSLYEADWDGKGIFSLDSGRFPRGAYFLHWRTEDDAGTLRVVFQ